MKVKINDITPEAYRMCGGCGCGCPAVLETDQDSYFIIGKKLTSVAAKQVEGKVAGDEYVIEVEKAMIDDLKLNIA